ncbi:MAG: STAS-like domain-containing protein [Myxococcales bacterium]|nr:STAS-like domain-containing protein [Myxococcales bacterium]
MTDYVDIGADFTMKPGFRYRWQGKASGQEFRETFLEPAIKAGRKVVVNLDGPDFFSTSFLEEAFGGAVRIFGDRAFELIELVSPAKPHRVEDGLHWMKRARASQDASA